MMEENNMEKSLKGVRLTAEQMIKEDKQSHENIEIFFDKISRLAVKYGISSMFCHVGIEHKNKSGIWGKGFIAYPRNNDSDQVIGFINNLKENFKEIP